MPEFDLPSMVLRDSDRATAEALRLAQLADEVTVRLRFGLVAFNAASMVALFSAVGAAGAFLTNAGITSSGALVAAGFFAAGTIASGISIFLTQTELEVRSRYADARAIALQTKAHAAATMLDAAFARADEAAREGFVEGQKRSPRARFAQHLSGFAWAGGLIILALQTFVRF